MKLEKNLEYDRPKFLQQQLSIRYTGTMNREGAKDILQEYFRKQGGWHETLLLIEFVEDSLYGAEGGSKGETTDVRGI
jgi:hypothetical protein